MSTATLAKWGNSVGIRLPKNIVKNAHIYLGETFKIIIKNNGEFVLQPVKKARHGWLEAFNDAAKKDNDKMLIGENVKNNFDEEEWTW